MMQDNSSTIDPAQALLDMASGNTSSLNIANEPIAISTGAKISNEVLKKFVNLYRSRHNNDTELVDMIVSLDEAVEKGQLTKENLNEDEK